MMVRSRSTALTRRSDFHSASTAAASRGVVEVQSIINSYVAPPSFACDLLSVAVHVQIQPGPPRSSFFEGENP